MIDERRRFAVALGGVAGLLAIAGAIAVSGSHQLQTVPVPADAGGRTLTATLPALPMPAVPMPAVPMPGSNRRARAVGTHPDRRPGTRQAQAADTPRPGNLAAAPRPAVLAAAPAAGWQQVLVAASPRVVTMPAAPSVAAASAESAGAMRTRIAAAIPETRRHGPVAGALVTAGQEMGAGFRTVGRTLKRLF